MAIQRLPILDQLPILLSSGCEFRSCRGPAKRGAGCKDSARDTRATTDVVAASLCEAIFRRVVVLCAAHTAAVTGAPTEFNAAVVAASLCEAIAPPYRLDVKNVGEAEWI